MRNEVTRSRLARFAIGIAAAGLAAACGSAPDPRPSPKVEPVEGTQLKDCGPITGGIQCCSQTVCCISADSDPSCIFCTDGSTHGTCHALIQN